MTIGGASGGGSKGGYGKHDVGSLVRGPIVGNVELDRFDLFMNGNRPGKVEVVLADGRRYQSSSGIGTIQHGLQVRVDGLTKGTTYTYTVESDGVTLESGSVRTKDDTGIVNFAFLSDCGACSPEQLDVRDEIDAFNPNFVCICGDVDQLSGSPSRYEQCFFGKTLGFGEILKKYPFFIQANGHDDDQGIILPGPIGSPAPPNYALQNMPMPPMGPFPPNYNFRWDNVEIWMLRTFETHTPPIPNGSTLQPGIRRWLAESLAASTATWKVVSSYSPVYAPPDLVSPAPADDPIWRAEIDPILVAGGVDLVFSGHWHHYHRTTAVAAAVVQTIGTAPMHFVTGGGGTTIVGGGTPQVWTAAQVGVHHYVGVTVAGNSITITPVDRTGSLIEAPIVWSK